MLTITIPAKELWNETTQEFIVQSSDVKLTMEHSLVSISKWESKWKKSFLKNLEKTPEESIDYIKCMSISKNIPDEIYLRLSNDNIRSIDEYINDTMTATCINTIDGKNKETITSELIYFWMISYNIPFECQKWHLNRLMTLIKICNAKNQSSSSSKRSPNEILANNAKINAERKKRLHKV